MQSQNFGFADFVLLTSVAIGLFIVNWAIFFVNF